MESLAVPQAQILSAGALFAQCTLYTVQCTQHKYNNYENKCTTKQELFKSMQSLG